MSCARFHKAQSLVRCSLFCTWRILRTGLPSTACLFTLMLMIHSCTSTSIVMISRHPSTKLSAMSLDIDRWMSVNRLKLNSDRLSTAIRQNCCKLMPAQVTAAPHWVAGIRYSRSQAIGALPAAMFVCLVLTSRLIWVWITTSLAFVRAATRPTEFFNSDVSGGRWTPTRWLHSSTPLWSYGLITATLFLLVHQGL